MLPSPVGDRAGGGARLLGESNGLSATSLQGLIAGRVGRTLSVQTSLGYVGGDGGSGGTRNVAGAAFSPLDLRPNETGHLLTDLPQGVGLSLLNMLGEAASGVANDALDGLARGVNVSARRPASQQSPQSSSTKRGQMIE